MAVAVSERKAARAAMRKICSQKQKRRNRKMKQTVKAGQTMSKSTDELGSSFASPSGWKPPSEQKAESQRKSESPELKKGNRRRLNSDDLGLPKEMVAANAKQIYNVKTLNEARKEFVAEIKEAKRNPETTVQRMAELEAGFRRVVEQIELQMGESGQSGTSHLTPEGSGLRKVKQPGLGMSEPSLPKSASPLPKFATLAASSLDAEEDGLAAKPRRGKQPQMVKSRSSRDLSATLQHLDLKKSDSRTPSAPLSTLHRLRRSSQTQMFVDFKMQSGTSTTMTLVEEALPPNSKPLASKKGSRATPSRHSSRIVSVKGSAARSSKESSRSPTATNSEIKSESSSSDDSLLSELSSKGMEELERDL